MEAKRKARSTNNLLDKPCAKKDSKVDPLNIKKEKKIE